MSIKHLLEMEKKGHNTHILLLGYLFYKDGYGYTELRNLN